MKFSHTSVTIGAVVVTALLTSTVSAGAAAVLITGAQIKDGTITAADLATNSVTGAKVQDKTLTSADFAPGTLLRGPRGASGGGIGLVQGVPTVKVLPAGYTLVTATCAGNQVAVAPQYSLASKQTDASPWGAYTGTKVSLHFSMQSPDQTAWMYAFENTEQAMQVRVTAGVLCSPQVGSIGLVQGVPAVTVIPPGYTLVTATCAANQTAVAPEYSVSAGQAPTWHPYTGTKVSLQLSTQAASQSAWVFAFENTEQATHVRVTAGVLCSTNP